MDKAYAHRLVASDIGYSLKQERHELASKLIRPPSEKYQLVKYNRLKGHQELVTKQLLRETTKFVSKAKYLSLQEKCNCFDDNYQYIW